MGIELEGVSSSFEIILKGAEKASKQLDDFVSQVSQLENVEIGKKGIKLDITAAQRQLATLQKAVTASYNQIANFKIDTSTVFAEGREFSNAFVDGVKKTAETRFTDVINYVNNVSQTLADAAKLASGKSANTADLSSFKKTVADITTELRTMRTLLTGSAKDMQALSAGIDVSEFDRLRSSLVNVKNVMKEYKGTADKSGMSLDVTGITGQVDKAVLSLNSLGSKTNEVFANIQSKLSKVEEPKTLDFEQVGQAIVSNIGNAFSKASTNARGALKEIGEAVDSLNVGDTMAQQILSPKVANAMAKLRDNITALQERSQELANLQERATAATSTEEKTSAGEALKKELLNVEALARKVAQANMNVSNEFFATQRALLTSMQSGASQLTTEFTANAAAVQRIAENTMRFKQGISDSLTKLGLGVDVLKQQENINNNILAIIRAGGEAEARTVAEMVRGSNAYKQTMAYAEKLQAAEAAIGSSRLSGNQALQMTNVLLKEQVAAYKQASIIGTGNDAVVAFDKMVAASQKLSANNAGIKLREDIASMVQTVTAGGVPAIDSLNRSITMFETNSGKAFSDQKSEIKMVKTLVEQLSAQYTALGNSATTAAKAQQQKVADLVSSISSTMLDQGLGKADTKLFESTQRIAEVNKENLAIDRLRVQYQTELVDQFNKVYALQVAGVSVASNYARMEELYIQAKKQGIELEDKLISRIKDRSGVMTKLASEVAGMQTSVNDNYIFPAGQVMQLKAIVDTLTLMKNIRASMDKKGEAATVVNGENLDVAALERQARAAQDVLRTKEAEIAKSQEGERVYAAINAILDKRVALEQGIIDSLKVAQEMNTNTLGAYDRYISMAEALVTTTQKGIPVNKELLDIDRSRELAVRELYTEYARLEKARIENKGGPQEGLLALQREKELLTKLAGIMDRDYKLKLETGDAEVGISNITKLIQTVENRMSKLDQLWKTQDKLFGKSDPEALRSLAQTVQNIHAALQDMAPTLKSSGEGFNSIMDATMRTDLALGKYTSKLKALYTEELSNASSTAKQREETLAVTAAMEREMAVVKGLQNALGGADSKLRAVGSSMTEATTDPKALADKLAGDPAKLASVQAAMQRIMEAMQAMSATKLNKGSVLEALNAEATQFATKVTSVVDALKTISATAGKVDLTKVNVSSEQAAAGREQQEQNILRAIEKQYQELLQGVNVLENWENIQKNIIEATRQGYSLGEQNVAVLTAQEDIYKKMFATAQELYSTAANDASLPQAARNAALEQALKLYTAIRDAATNMPAGNFAASMDLTKVIADAEKLRDEFGTNIPSALQKLLDEGERLGEVLKRAVNVASTSSAPAGFEILRQEIDNTVTALNTLRGNTGDVTAYTAAQGSIEKVVAALQSWRAEQEQLNTKDGVVSAEFQKTAATIDNIVGRMNNWVEKNNELRASGMDTQYDGAKQDINGIIAALTDWGGKQANIYEAAKAGTVFEKTATSMDLILTHLKDWKAIQEKIYDEQTSAGQDIAGLQSQREKVREAERLLALMQQMRAISEKISVKSASVGVDSGTLGTAAGVAQLAAATKETPKLYLDIVKASQEYKGLLATIEKSIGSSETLEEIFKSYAPTLSTAKAEVDKVNTQLATYANSKALAASNSAGQSIFDVTRMSWFMQLRAFWSMYLGVTQTITSVVEYTHALNIMKAATEASNKTIETMNENFMRLGQDVPIATTKVAEAAVEVAKAGMSAEETLYIINAATKLAHATKADIAMVADVLTVSLTAWGVSANKADEIADVMFSAMSKSRADMEGMQQAMGYLSGIAPQANVGIKETLGLIGVLTNAGLSMSKAATYSRQVLNDLMNPSAKLTAILGSLGVNLRDVDPRFNSLATIFKRLSDAGMNVSQAFEGMSVRGANAFSVALSNADKLNDFTDSLEANGALLREYADTTQDVSSQFTLLMNAFTALGNTLKEGSGAFLMGMIDGVRESIYGLISVLHLLGMGLGDSSNIMRATGSIVAKLFLTFAAGAIIMKVIGWFKMLATGLVATTTATVGLRGAIGSLVALAMSNPWTATIAALTTIAGIMYSLTSSSDGLGDSIANMAEKVAQLREEIAKLNKMKLQTAADVNIVQRFGAFEEGATSPRLQTEAGRENVAASFRGAMNTLMQTGSDEAKEVGKQLLAAMPSSHDGASVWSAFFKEAHTQLDSIRTEAEGLAKTINSQQKDIVEKANGSVHQIIDNLQNGNTDELLKKLSSTFEKKRGEFNGFDFLSWFGADADKLDPTGKLDFGKKTEAKGIQYNEQFAKTVGQSVGQLNEMIDGMGNTGEAQKFVDKISGAYKTLSDKIKATAAEIKASGRDIPDSLLNTQRAIDAVLAKQKKWQGQTLPSADDQLAQTMQGFNTVTDKSRAQNNMDTLTDIITALKDVNTQAGNLKSVADIGLLTGKSMDGAREKINKVGEALGLVMARVAESKNTLATLPAEDAKNVVDAVKSIWGAIHEQMLLGSNAEQLTIDQLVSKVTEMSKKLKLSPSGVGRMLKIGTEATTTLRNQSREGGLDSYDDLTSKVSNAAHTKQVMQRSGMVSPNDIQAVDEVLASLIKTQFAFINSMLKTKYAVASATGSYDVLDKSVTNLRDTFGEQVDAADYTKPFMSMANLLSDTFYSTRSEISKTIMSINELKDNVKTTDAEFGALGVITGKNEKVARAYQAAYAGHAQTVASQMTSMQTKIEASYTAIKTITDKMATLRTTMLNDEQSFVTKLKSIADSTRSNNDNMKIAQENVTLQGAAVQRRIQEGGLQGEDLESAVRTLRDSFLDMADTYKFDPESRKYMGQAESMQSMLGSLEQTRMEKLELERQVAQLQQAMQLEIYKNLQTVLEQLMDVLKDLGNKIAGYDKAVSGELSGAGGAAYNFPTMTKATKAMLQAVMMTESGGNPNAVSSKGAIGRMQVMPDTAHQPGHGITPVRNESVEEYDRVGRELLSKLLATFKGDVVQALAAYNWGEGKVNSTLGNLGIAKGDTSGDDRLIAQLPAETQNYIAKIYDWLAQRGKIPAKTDDKKQAAGTAAPAAAAATAPGDKPTVGDLTTPETSGTSKMADLQAQLEEKSKKGEELVARAQEQAQAVGEAVGNLKPVLNQNAQYAGTAAEALKKFDDSIQNTGTTAVNTAVTMFTSIKDSLGSALTEATKNLVDGSGDIDQVFTNLYWSLVDAYYKMLMDMLMKTVTSSLLDKTADAAGGVADASITAAQEARVAQETANANTQTVSTGTFETAVSTFGMWVDKLGIALGFKTPTDVYGDTTAQTVAGATADVASDVTPGVASSAADVAAGNIAISNAAASLEDAAVATSANVAREASNIASEASTKMTEQATASAEAAAISQQQVAANTLLTSANTLNGAAGMLQSAASNLTLHTGDGGGNTPSGSNSLMEALFGPGSHEGGLQVPGFNIGGYTQGGNVKEGNRAKDSMLAALTKGEYVVQEPIVRSLGVEFFKDLNAGKAQSAFDRLPGITGTSMNDKGYSPPASAATSAKTGQSGGYSGKPSVSINNLVDPKVVERYLATDRGKTAVTNIVSQHPYFKKS